MDLETFLELEKRQIAEERKQLCGQSDETTNALISISNPFTSMEQEKNIQQPREDNFLSKRTKDWINKQYNNKLTEDAEATTLTMGHKKKNQDDMEQWVSDTFYSYFPGFNNEYQKRQSELRRKQRENEENLIKHQMINTKQSKKHKHIASARSINSSLASNGGGNGSSHSADKTDIEIINVNNPNYIPLKHSANSLRPDSARYRLLQDLRHTNLTNLTHDSPEDTIEINRRQAEIESARKKEYQRELMQQIEEKRQSIKLLRDKEQQQEEVLTRRLQEQLRTMKLEEQLEKERIKAVKVRFDTEQNRLSREHLLAKLEKDSQLISGVNIGSTMHANETNKENFSNRQDNKVYKYFSNAEKHDYSYRNKSSSLPTEIDLELDETEMAKIERECFHLSEKICPMCDEPLKELENFCLRCQSKLSFRIKSPIMSVKNTNKSFESEKSKSSEDNNDKNSTQHDFESDRRSFFLVCLRCERLYSWCKTCTRKSDLCKACQNKRNLCMTCRKTLCSFCLEEVACGRDSESLHINDRLVDFADKTTTKDEDNPKEIHFQIKDNGGDSFKNNNKSSNISSFSTEYSSSLNNLDDTNDPPYSINIEKNSIFHPDNKIFSLFTSDRNTDLKTQEVGEINTDFYKKDSLLNTSNNDDINIERLRRDTDKKLSLYMKNYGDLAYQSRGTQTTPTTTGRRDIVLKGENSLSIPLLREMPKMTRLETNKFKGNSKKLQDLQHRWDVPAVQKFTISPQSPKVVTQIGAIRKQLQIDRLFSEDTDS